MSKREKLEMNVKTQVGTITVPVTRVDKGLCLRFHLCTATDSKKQEWHINHSGGAIVIDVPNKHRHYSVSLEDILREIVLKEKD